MKCMIEGCHRRDGVRMVPHALIILEMENSLQNRYEEVLGCGEERCVFQTYSSVSYALVGA